MAGGWLAGCPLISTFCYKLQEGEWGEVVVAGAQLENTSTPDGGLKCTLHTYGGLKCTDGG
jgi:hypothetical protein